MKPLPFNQSVLAAEVPRGESKVPALPPDAEVASLPHRASHRQAEVDSNRPSFHARLLEAKVDAQRPAPGARAPHTPKTFAKPPSAVAFGDPRSALFRSHVVPRRAGIQPESDDLQQSRPGIHTPPPLPEPVAAVPDKEPEHPDGNSPPAASSLPDAGWAVAEAMSSAPRQNPGLAELATATPTSVVASGGAVPPAAQDAQVRAKPDRHDHDRPPAASSLPDARWAMAEAMSSPPRPNHGLAELATATPTSVIASGGAVQHAAQDAQVRVNPGHQDVPAQAQAAETAEAPSLLEPIAPEAFPITDRTPHDAPEDHSLPNLELEKAAPDSGIVDAEQESLMKTVVEMENSAGPAMKNLPGLHSVPESPSGRLSIQTLDQSDARGAAEGFLPPSQPAVSASVATAPPPPAVTSGPIEQAQSAQTARMVERVEQAVLHGLAEVRHAGATSLAVVVKPDAATELLLRVDMKDGALSAHLQFERGNHAVLDEHWDDLQRRMAEQGVTLTRSDVSDFNGGGSFTRSQHQPAAPDDEAISPALIRRGASDAPTPASAPRPSSSLFESWA